MTDRQLTLTRGEEEIMRILWQLGDATIGEIITCTDEPHPKYTTVATFLRILEGKGFVYRKAEGRGHRYYPAIERENYTRSLCSSLLRTHFDGSLAQMVSFFAQHEKIPIGEMEEILDIMRQARQ